jgi:hypothetical protein
MKTLKNLSLTFIIIATFHAASHAIIFSGENSVIYSGQPKSVSTVKIKKQFVHATINKGKLIPKINLPEITIYAERKIKNRLPVTIRGEETIANIDLPEVVIVADFPESKIVSAVFYKGQFIPSIYLPVVEITASKSEVLLSSNDENKSTKGTKFVFATFIKAEAKMNNSLTHVILILVKTCFMEI